MKKVVLVTGASSGMGAAIAEAFAKKTANLALVGRNETKLKKVSDKCEKYRNKPLIIRADLNKDEDLKRVVNTTIDKYGKLDVLVNNAGIIGMTNILDDNLMEVFDGIIATNLRAAVYLTHLAAPHLIKTKGNIVNISSIAALIPFNQRTSAYGTAKAGLEHFTKCVAYELAPKGVRANNVNPGPVKTDLFHKRMTEEEEKSLWKNVLKGSPMNEMPNPADVANLVLFLASDEAKCITGSSHIIDCGTILKGSVNISD